MTLSLITIKVSVDQDTDTLAFFLDPNNYFYDSMILEIQKDHPELVSQLKFNKKYRQSLIVEYAHRYYQTHQLQISQYQKELDAAWKQIEIKVIQRLSELLEVDWHDTSICYVGMARLYPRNLEQKSFQVCCLDSIEFSLAVMLHELTHLIYFAKWHELFPSDLPNTHEAPHPFWHLSEIMGPLINADTHLMEWVNEACVKSYPEYDRLLNNRSHDSIYTSFANDYAKCRGQKESINIFLHEARTKALKILQ
jgi:hypothetical protein